MQPIDSVCRGVSGVGFVNDVSGCPNYFACVNGKAYPGVCPQGSHFNPARSACDFAPANGRCDNICPSMGVHTYPVEKSCTDYTFCYHGEESVFKCAAGLQYDQEIGQCNLEVRVRCMPNPCPQRDVPGVPVFVANPNDCRSYFVCISGDLLSLNCPPGTLFNSRISACESALTAPACNVPSGIPYIMTEDNNE